MSTSPSFAGDSFQPGVEPKLCPCPGLYPPISAKPFRFRTSGRDANLAVPQSPGFGIGRPSREPLPAGPRRILVQEEVGAHDEDDTHEGAERNYHQAVVRHDAVSAETNEQTNRDEGEQHGPTERSRVGRVPMPTRSCHAEPSIPTCRKTPFAE